VEHLKHMPQTGAATCCLHIYFHDGDDENELTMESLYANLLAQLLRQHHPSRNVSTELAKQYKESKSQRITPNQDEFLDLLRIESGAFTNRLYPHLHGTPFCMGFYTKTAFFQT
jgi:hypothetical protein